MQFNNDRFKARVYHGLKSLLTPGDTLPPRFLEYAICQAFDMDHVGDGNFYADGVKGNIQASIKTRMLNPHVLKTKQGRDFHTHPAMFLGPHQNVKQNRWTGGMEIVQRRQALDFDDIKATPDKIGKHSIEGFVTNVEESHKKYGTSISQEVVGIHGYDHTQKNYIVSLFWKELDIPDPADISWKREGYGVAGYKVIDGISQKIAERINGNAKREATCFKEYKNLTLYQNSAQLVIPIPTPWEFNEVQILQEISSHRV